MFNFNKCLFFMVIAVKYHECSEPNEIIAPFSFDFNLSQALHMNLKLKNMAYSHEYNKYTIYFSDALAGTGSIPLYETGKNIRFEKYLNHGNVTVYMKLWKDDEYCTTIPICNGYRRESGASKICRTETCDVIVDMKNISPQCPANYNISCNIEQGKYYICKSIETRFTPYGVHQYLWTHTNNNHTFIGTIPTVNRTRSILNITLEDFDRNTFVQQTITRTDAEARKEIKSNLIKIPDFDGNSLQISEVEILRYSQKYLPELNCGQHKAISKDIQVAFVDKEHKIQTLKSEGVVMNEPNIKVNGSMLCCIYYTVEDVGGTKQVTRHVKNKKLLIYQEITNPNYTIFYIAIGVAITIVIITIILIITIKVLKKKTGVQQVELETYASPSNVSYAELNVNGTNQRTFKPQEGAYAVIVGIKLPRHGTATGAVSSPAGVHHFPSFPKSI